MERFCRGLSAFAGAIPNHLVRSQIIMGRTIYEREPETEVAEGVKWLGHDGASLKLMKRAQAAIAWLASRATGLPNLSHHGCCQVVSRRWKYIVSEKTCYQLGAGHRTAASTTVRWSLIYHVQRITPVKLQPVKSRVRCLRMLTAVRDLLLSPPREDWLSMGST